MYKQIDGETMVISLGPVSADKFLWELECELDIGVQDTKLYAKFVDGTLTVCKNEQ